MSISSPSLRLIIAAAFALFTPKLYAQTLIWDANATSAGQTNGAGTWTATNQWWNGSANVTWDNGVSTIAQFGTTASAAGGAITTGAINLAGLNFASFSAAPTSAYTISSGGSLTFGTGQFIQLADLSSTASLFANISSTITAANLTVRKSGGTAHQFIRFDNTANTGLSGTLTLATGNGGVFLRIAAPGTLGTVTQVNVETGNTLSLLTPSPGSYSQILQISGTGDTNRGAIRIDSSNLTLDGNIVMTGDSMININANINNTVINGIISETGGARALTRISQNPGMILRLSAANTYTGATTLGGITFISGGINILDFSGTNSPTTNILYNNVAAGALNLAGGTGASSVLALVGKAGAANAQTLGAVTVTGTTTGITASSGAGGSMALTTGAVTRTSNAAISFAGPASGSITVGNSAGFLGAWTTYTSGTGTGSWATVLIAGTLANYTGTLAYTTGSTLGTLATATSDVTLSSSSTGSVTVSGTTTTINTLSMTDLCAARTVAISGTDILRVGGASVGGGGNVAGGFQMITGAQSLTLGTVAGSGVITGGGVANTVGQISFTNFSAQPMIVNAAINNNGTGGQNVLINGTGRVIFNGGGNYSADTIVGSGILEIRNSNALGSTASNLTRVLDGAALQIGGGISTPEAIAINGNGISNGGAIRNVDGSNTLTGLTTITSTARIHSESGTLTFAPTAGTSTNTMTGASVTFSGPGSTVILGRLNLTTGTLTKEGTGTLTISGDSGTVFTGTATVAGGAMRMTTAAGLSTASIVVSENVTTGSALELTGGINVSNGITFNGTGNNANTAVNGAGAIRSVSGTNTLSGTLSVGTLVTTPRISSDSGSTLILSGIVRSGATAAGTRNVQLGGAGTINVTGQITNGTTPATYLTSLDKVESGTVNLRAASTLTPNTTTPTAVLVNVRGGTLNFDFANATPASALVPSTNNLGLGGNGTAAVNGTIFLGSAMGGGTALFSGKDSTVNTQNFAGTTLAGGRSAITLVSGASGTMNVALGPITRANSSGSAVMITLPTTGTLSTTTPNTNGIINGGMAVGNSTWATSAATSATAVNWTTSAITLAGYTNGQQVSFTGTAPGGLTAGVGYYVVGATGSNFQVAATEGGTAITLSNTGSTGTMNTGGAITGLASYSATFAANTNVDVATGPLTQAAVTVNSLRFNGAAGTTLSLSGTLTSLSGGILITPTVTGDVTIQSNTAGTARTLSSSTSPADFTVHHHGSGLLSFSSDITLTNATGFTKTGAGAMTFAGNSASTAMQIRATEGTLNFVGNNQFTSATDPVLYFGSATTSAKISFGNGVAAGAETLSAMYVLGTGSSMVGNSAQLFALSLQNTSTTDLRTLTIGGSSTNENNLSFEVFSGGTVLMGSLNTYAGRTNLGRATLEVGVIDNAGSASSLGTGNSSSAIVMNDTSSTAATVSTLRYIGSTNSSTDRAVRLYTDGQPMPSLTGVIENNGSGTLKFTSSFTTEGNTTLGRTLRLTGTNTGINEIVGIGNGPSSTVGLDKAGAGTWSLTGNSSYTGGTTVTAGTLQLGTGGTAGMVGTGDIAISSGAVLAVNRSNAQSLANNITGAGSVIISNGSSGVTTLSSNTNTYSGGTTVSSGSLSFTNTTGSATGTGAVTVAPGATLSGDGLITPAANNGLLVCGNLSVGTLSSTAADMAISTSGSSSLTIDNSGALVFDLVSGAGSGALNGASAADRLLVGGVMTINAGSTLRVQNLNSLTGWSLGDSWRLLDWTTLTGSASGTFTSFDLPTLGVGLNWDTAQIYSLGTISIVPEPSRCLLIAIGGLCLISIRRRHGG